MPFHPEAPPVEIEPVTPSFGRSARGVSALGLVLLTANCACCFEPCYTSPPPLDPIEVSRIEIVPAVTYATAGTSFQLEARVRDADGRVIAVDPPPVDWSGPPELTFWPNPANPTVLVLPGPDAMTGPTHTIEGIVAEVGGRESPPARVVMVPPAPADPDFDGVALPHKPGDPPAIVLLDAIEGGMFQEDLMVAVAGRAFFDRNLADGAGPRSTAPEVATFSGDGGFLFEDRVSMGGGTWTNLRGDLLQRATLPDRAKVSVVLLDAAEEDVRLQMSDHLDLAQVVFDRSRLGIELETVAEAASSAPLSWSFAWESRDDIHEKFGIGDPIASELKSRPVIYAVYVEDHGISSGMSHLLGLSKTPPFGLVTILADPPSPLILAHELGHALGLRYGIISQGGGHADEGMGFDCSNLMWIGIHSECPSNQDRLSLGQAFRIRVDQLGWLQKTGAGGESRDCRGDSLQDWKAGDSDYPCPCISLDGAEGGGSVCRSQLVEPSP